MNKLSFYITISFILGLQGCSGCSKTGRRVNQDRQTNNRSVSVTKNIERNHSKEKATVKMVHESGAYMVPIEINGMRMNFIFDTGASDIIISLAEALVMIKQGSLVEDDVVGTEQYMMANGDIVEGTVINLRTVKVGNRVLHNVKASISHSISAPILLGQSALSRFGKISIDYNKKEIYFE